MIVSLAMCWSRVSKVLQIKCPNLVCNDYKFACFDINPHESLQTCVLTRRLVVCIERDMPPLPLPPAYQLLLRSLLHVQTLLSFFLLDFGPHWAPVFSMQGLYSYYSQRLDLVWRTTGSYSMFHVKDTCPILSSGAVCTAIITVPYNCIMIFTLFSYLILENPWSLIDCVCS